MATDVELAYAAGLFDGEGCVACGFERGVQARVKAVVSLTDPRPLLRMQKLFGGSLRFVPPTKKNHRTKCCWELGSGATTLFLSAVLPYLIIKRDQALLAIELQTRIRATPKVSKGRAGVLPLTQEEWAARAAYINQIKTLKRREFFAAPQVG